MSTSYTLEELNAMLALNEDTEISEVTSAEYLETNASDEFVYRVMHMSAHKGEVVENRLFVETNEDGDLVAVVYDHGDDDPDQTEVDIEEAMESHPDALNSEFPLTSAKVGRQLHKNLRIGAAIIEAGNLLGANKANQAVIALIRYR